MICTRRSSHPCPLEDALSRLQDRGTDGECGSFSVPAPKLSRLCQPCRYLGCLRNRMAHVERGFTLRSFNFPTTPQPDGAADASRCNVTSFCCLLYLFFSFCGAHEKRVCMITQRAGHFEVCHQITLSRIGHTSLSGASVRLKTPAHWLLL